MSLIVDGNYSEDSYHAKSLTMFYGLQSEFEKGWQLADGTNDTPDMRGFFPRGASSDSEVGSVVGFTTALPTTKFMTDSDAHDHTTPETSVSTSEDTHNHEIDGDSAEGINGGGTSTGDAVLNNNDGSNDHDFNTTSDTHKHTVTIPVLTTSSKTHNHELTGGDAETAPDHIYVYWIAYTGKLAPNWSDK